MPFKAKEQQLKYLAVYRKTNKAKLLDRCKRRVICACGTICSYNSLGRHRITKTHLKYEEKHGGKTIKEYNETSECLFMDSDETEEEEKETSTASKIAEPKEAKPI